MSLKGRIALVTGSTSGIGLGIAHALAEAGADVMLNGFGDAAIIQAARSSIESLGVRCAHDGADISDPAQAHALVERTRAALGTPDILVNNAGIQHTSTIAAFPPPAGMPSSR